MDVKVKRIGGHNLPLPKYETKGASGFDLRAVVAYDEMREQAIERNLSCGTSSMGVSYVNLHQGDSVSLPCGFAFSVPDGYELQVRPRSGLSANGVHVVLGTVDSDYRGEVRILLRNMGEDMVTITHGDRIAQGVIAPVWQATLTEVEELTPTERGANGFGSTGSK